MDSKFDKNTHCGYCGNEMEAKYRNKRFCSDKCRIYFNRENKKIEVKDLDETSKIVKPITDKPKETNFSINTERPQRMTDENAFDYAFRINEWKQSLKQ